MKGLIILGAGRSGKSSLARTVAHYHGCNVIHLDPLVGAFSTAFPDLGIGHRVHSTGENKKIAPFIAAYANETIEYGPLVIEGSNAFLPVDMAAKLFNQKVFKILCVGCHQMTPEEMLTMIRAKDTPDEWSFYVPDDYLLQRCQRHIQKTQELFAECEKLGIEMLDTSYNRDTLFPQFTSRLCFEPFTGASQARRDGLRNFFKQNGVIQ